MPDPQPPSPAMEKADAAIIEACKQNPQGGGDLRRAALQAALSTLLQGESREELVEVMARAIYEYELGESEHFFDFHEAEHIYRETSSAALDALAHHLLGEQKPDE